MSRLIKAVLLASAAVLVGYQIIKRMTRPRPPQRLLAPMTSGEFLELYARWEAEERTTRWVQSELLRLKNQNRLPSYLTHQEIMHPYNAFVLASLADQAVDAEREAAGPTP